MREVPMRLPVGRIQVLALESATAAVGYPGTEEAYTQRLVEAGATLIERPVTELAPAGSQSIAYPLDQPEVLSQHPFTSHGEQEPGSPCNTVPGGLQRTQPGSVVPRLPFPRSTNEASNRDLALPDITPNATATPAVAAALPAKTQAAIFGGLPLPCSTTPEAGPSDLG